MKEMGMMGGFAAASPAFSSAAVTSSLASAGQPTHGCIPCAAFSVLRPRTLAPFNKLWESTSCELTAFQVKAMAEARSTSKVEAKSSGKRRALISVSDKSDLALLGTGLQELGFTIVSTGGTASALESSDVSVTKLEKLTGFPEMLDGRVKTLHPVIHAGILARRDQKHHMEALDEHGIGTFDLVVVNFYPFYDKATSSNGISFEDMMQYFDVGGPGMIRATVKNHKDVLVVVDPKDYPALLEYLKGGQDDEQLRWMLAGKAYQYSIFMDSVTVEWMR